MSARDTLVLGPPMAAGAFLIGVSVWACFLNLTDTMSGQPWVLRVASVAGPASLGLGLIKIVADLAKARAPGIEARLTELRDRVVAMQATLDAMVARGTGPATPTTFAARDADHEETGR